MHVLKSTLREHRGYILLAALLLAMLFFTSPVMAFSGSGAGTAGDPYQITTTSQWAEMNNYLAEYSGGYFKLMNDLDFAGASINPIGSDTQCIGGFDGQYYTVKNIVIHGGSRGRVGLFSWVVGNEIKNLALINVDVDSSVSSGQTLVGVVIGGLYNGGHLTNIIVDSTSSVSITDGGSQYLCAPMIGQMYGSSHATGVSGVPTFTATGLTTHDFYGVIGSECGSNTVTNCYYGGSTSGGSSAGTQAGCGSSSSAMVSAGYALASGAFNNVPAASGFPVYTNPPTLSSVTPSSAYNTGTVSGLSISGTGFVNGATTVKISKSGSSDISGTSVSVTGTTSLTCDLPITGATVGTWSLTVTTAGGTSSGSSFVISNLPPPTAAFHGVQYGQTLSYLYPENNTFTMTDDSTGTPTSWLWQFGDGTSNSTSQSPSHTFAAPATTTTYTVTLTATNAGGSNSVSHNYVYYRAPVASLTVLGAGAPYTWSFIGDGAYSDLNFQDSSSNTPTAWNWSFGDGDYSTVEDPAHNYDGNGDYTLGLTVTNPAGTSTVSYYQLFHTKYPVTGVTLLDPSTNPSAVGDTIGTVGGSMYGGDAYEWWFDWGDGSAIVVGSLEHVYSTAGVFDVSFAARDYDGVAHYNNTTDWITITGAVDAAFTMSASGVAPIEIDFTDTSTGGGTWSSSTWNFGDGYSSNARNPSHTYTVPGTYSVSMLWMDTLGQSGYFTDSLTISSSSSPTAGFTPSVVTGDYPLAVTFTGAPSAGTPPYTSFDWNFGDGSAHVTTQNATHTFTSGGYSTVTYTVTDSLSNAGSSQEVIYVTTPGAPTVDFTSTSYNPYVGVTLTFTDTSSGGTWASSYWNFGDGGTSTLRNPTHAYATVGTFTPSVIWRNTVGGWGYATKTINANPRAPATPEFTNTPSTGTYPFAAQFNYTGGVGVGTMTYLWNFGDGSTSTVKNATHTFTTAGNYNVRVTVTCTESGLSWYKDHQVVVSDLAAPVVNFTLSQSSGYYPVTVTVNGTITGGAPPYNSIGYDFGDGSGSFYGYNFTHTYTTAGVYTILFLAGDSAGKSDYEQKQFTSLAAGTPSASFTASNVSGNVPKPVTFTDTSTGSPTAWFWQFGDGTTSALQNPVKTYSTDGTYYVNLTATNTGGNSSAQKVLTFLATVPTSSFTVTPTTGQAPLLVTVNDTSTGSPTSVAIGVYTGIYPALTEFVPLHSVTIGGSTNFMFNNGGTYTIIQKAYGGGSFTTTTQVINVNASGTPVIPMAIPGVTAFGAATAPNITHSLYSTTMNTSATPVEAWLGDTALFQTNTSGITTFNNYKVDGWKVAVYKQKPMQPGVYSTPVSTILVNASGTNSGISTFDVALNTTETLSTGFDYGNATYLMKLFAINNSYVVPSGGTNYGQGLMLAASDDVNVEFAEPYVAWTSAPNPKPGDTITLTWDMNSFKGTPQSKAILSLESSTNQVTFFTVTGYGSIQVAETGSQEFITTHAQTIRARAVAYSSIFVVPLNQISTLWYPLLIQDTQDAASFTWKNNGGVTITSAVDTDVIRYGLDTGTSWQNHNYPTLTLTFYKYNVATDNWDLLTYPAAHTWTWGQQQLQESDTIILNNPNLFLSSDSTVKLRAIATSGSNSIVQSSDLTIRRNAINPSNAANAVGGWMGLGAGLGGILFGTIIAGLIAGIAFFLVRDARVFIIGGLAGVAIAFALGLYPIWLIVVIGIAGVGAMLFASGLLGGRGEGGTPPVEG